MSMDCIDQALCSDGFEKLQNFWFVCRVMHCDYKSRSCKPGKGTGDQMQYILPNFEFQPYVQKLFYIQFTINQTNHNNYMPIWIFMPCVLQGIRKPIHKKSSIPSLFCVSTPLLSCFEVKKTTKFDWFWVNKLHHSSILQTFRLSSSLFVKSCQSGLVVTYIICYYYIPVTFFHLQ